MAKKKRWWSPIISEQKKWFASYPIALEKYRDELKVTDGELEQAQKDAAMFKFICEYPDKIMAYYKYSIKYKKEILSGKAQKSFGKLNEFVIIESPDEVLSGLLSRTFTYVFLLKLRGGYNNVIGLTLKIIGSDPDFFDREEYVANGNATVTEDGIRIKFKKGKVISGMDVYCQRGDDPEFYRIAQIIKGTGKYKDKRPNLVDGVPEIRTYRTRAFIGNDLIGNYSPEFKVTCLINPIPVKKEEEKLAEENNTD